MQAFFTFFLAVVPFTLVQAAPAACPARVNAATISLLKQLEGFIASPAQDPIGLPTVGYGHLCKSKNCSEVKFKFPLTQDTATELLNSDLVQFTTCLNSAVKGSVKLNDNQFGALTSWTFDEGCGTMRTSNLVKRLNRGEDPNTVAGSELPQWNLAGGEVQLGLVRRRAAEVKLFQTSSSNVVHPC